MRQSVINNELLAKQLTETLSALSESLESDTDFDQILNSYSPFDNHTPTINTFPSFLPNLDVDSIVNNLLNFELIV